MSSRLRLDCYLLFLHGYARRDPYPRNFAPREIWIEDGEL